MLSHYVCIHTLLSLIKSSSKPTPRSCHDGAFQGIAAAAITRHKLQGLRQETRQGLGLSICGSFHFQEDLQGDLGEAVQQLGPLGRIIPGRMYGQSCFYS